MSIRLGIDVGGTFTDFLLFDDEKEAFQLHKTLSTLEDQSIGIIEGMRSLLDQANLSPDDIQSILHGTTVATNIVLEENGARVGLIVTKGFEQVLHLARSQTPGPLAGWITMGKPEPLADLELTRGIPERINAQGEILLPLDEKRAREITDELVRNGVDSITISLLHSYANPIHEQKIRDIITSSYPDLPISLSSEILPEFREYERTLVTVMNSYVSPGMRHYLDNFRYKLESERFNTRLNIVRSDSGLMGVERAMESPVYTLLSGPAGGVAGAAHLTALAGYPNALGFDMGGTSTDVSLIQDGQPTSSRQTVLCSYPLKIPSVEVHSVGAGGGSIAHVPMTGAIRVGPKSAGAFPGPACYGKGGTNATVTDANVILGRLPDSLLGGRMALDTKAAEDVVGALGRPLNLNLYETAQGIIDIVNENMFGALRLATVQRGLDLRNFSLVPFGGAGPLHANALAMLGQCYPVIVPPTPGVLSALGFLNSSVRHEASRTLIRNLDIVEPKDMETIMSDLKNRVEQWLEEEGITSRDQTIRHEVDLRYLRQGYELSLVIQEHDLNNTQELKSRFSSRHQELYGFQVDNPVEIVNLRAIGIGHASNTKPSKTVPDGPDSSAAVTNERAVYFDGKSRTTGVYDRTLLKSGNEIAGPALVTQIDSTTLIHPDHLARIDEYLNLVITPAPKATHQ